jgi:adenylosuccinate lyase
MDNLIEYVHFTCTSEDINNISYALMLKDSVSDVLIPEFDEVYASMRQIALDVKI